MQLLDCELPHHKQEAPSILSGYYYIQAGRIQVTTLHSTWGREDITSERGKASKGRHIWNPTQTSFISLGGDSALMVLELPQSTSLSESPEGFHPLGQEPGRAIRQPTWEEPLHIYPVLCSLLQVLRAELSWGWTKALPSDLAPAASQTPAGPGTEETAELASKLRESLSSVERKS